MVSTLITTILGTMIGIALGKYRFRGQGPFNLLLFAVISAPEIVLGASLLTLFTTLNTGLDVGSGGPSLKPYHGVLLRIV